MSNLTDDIQESIETAKAEINSARTDPDPQGFAETLTSAIQRLHWARRLSTKVRPGILAEGIAALIQQQEDAARSLMIRAFSGGGE